MYYYTPNRTPQPSARHGFFEGGPLDARLVSSTCIYRYWGLCILVLSERS